MDCILFSLTNQKNTIFLESFSCLDGIKSLDPRVDMAGGAKGIFDALEDLSVGYCLKKCAEINAYVNPAA